MLDLLVRVYRANPFRPHCASAEGRHAWPCRLVSAVLADDKPCPKRGLPRPPGIAAGCPDPGRRWTSDDWRFYCPPTPR
jgi:hypothetical protein